MTARWGSYDGDRERIGWPITVAIVGVVVAFVTLAITIGDPGAPWDVQTAQFVTEPTADTSYPATSATWDTASTVTPSPVPVDGGPVGSVTPAATARRGTSVPVATPPQPAVATGPTWAGPLPNYRGRGACTPEQAAVITGVFAAAGATVDTQEWALLVASRETGCDTSKRNQNARTRDDSYGWCQLNARAGHFGPNGVLAGWDRDRLLVDLEYAAQACAALWSVCGRGPWTPPYSCQIPPELR